MFGDGAGTIFSDKGSAQDATMASLKNCLGKNGYQQKNTLNWGRGYFIYNCYGIFPNGGDEYWVKSCATGTSAADATGNVHYAFWKAVNRPEQVSFTDNVCWNGRCGIPFTTSYLTYQTINYSVDVKIDGLDGPKEVTNNGTVILTWKADGATNCVPSSNWFGLDGEAKGNIAPHKTYSLTCQFPGLVSGLSDSATAYVRPQISNFYILDLNNKKIDGEFIDYDGVRAVNIPKGERVKIWWEGLYADKCEVSGGQLWIKTGLNGVESTDALNFSQTYSLGCFHQFAGVSDSIRVRVLGPFNLQIFLPSFGKVVSEPVGIDCRDDCREEFLYKTIVSLRAIPDAGWKFMGWGNDCSDGANPCVLSMDGNKSVSADFVQEVTPPPTDTNGADETGDTGGVGGTGGTGGTGDTGGTGGTGGNGGNGTGFDIGNIWNKIREILPR